MLGIGESTTTSSERLVKGWTRASALYLHVRHHGIAEGSEHQPCTRPAMDALVCRHDGCAAGRPDVQLPADVSQYWRGIGARCDSRRWRECCHSREVFSEPVLERRYPMGLHNVPVHWRVLSVLAPSRSVSKESQP